MPAQEELTILARVRSTDLEGLRQLMKAMSIDPANNSLLPFARLPNTHFARFVILDEAEELQGFELPPYLLFLSDFDGSVTGYLNQLVDVVGSGIDQIFCHCEGYPASSRITRSARLAYLRNHTIPAAAGYVNTVGRTVKQIRQEAQLHKAIENYLDRCKSDWFGRDALEVRLAVQRYVTGQKSLRWAKKLPEGPGLFYQIQDRLDLVRLPFLMFLLSPFLLAILPIWSVLLRFHELTDPAPDILPDEAHMQELLALEDYTAQNQFTAIGYVKPGLFRRLTAQGVLLLIQYAARHVYNHASLAGVKTIHFARWIFIDDYRRVLFASNYDGSVEAYNDDFINIVAWGLNAVFSNGVGYPKTSWLVMGGAWDEQAFKHYIRTHQIPSQVWYSAYPQLTAENIENNAQIRLGLYGRMDAAAAQEWLSRF